MPSEGGSTDALESMAYINLRHRDVEDDGGAKQFPAVGILDSERFAELDAGAAADLAGRFV
jgi:hypothetical protein